MLLLETCVCNNRAQPRWLLMQCVMRNVVNQSVVDCHRIAVRVAIPMRTWYSQIGAGQEFSLNRPSCSTVGKPACSSHTEIALSATLQNLLIYC